MHHIKYLILLLLFSVKLYAQQADKTDLTGLWKGTLYNDSTHKYYRYEIGINEEKGKLGGFSHTFFMVDDREYYGVKKVKVKRKEGKIIIEDDGLISNNYPVEPAKGVRQLNILTLEIKDSIMTLSGPFSTNRTKNYASLTGTINLKRKNDFWQSALVPHLQELGLADELLFVKKEKEKEMALAEIKKTAPNDITRTDRPVIKNDLAQVDKKKEDKRIEQKKKNENEPPVKDNKKAGSEVKAEPRSAEEKQSIKSETTPVPIATEVKQVVKAEPKPVPPAAEVGTRSTEIQQTVYFSSDSLNLSLYDNGEVDGDTVSVLMNGKLIMAKEGLSTKAVQKTIYAPQDADSIELVMYAENLGTIAPNTGLLVVHDGPGIYEIRFSGDLKKNASIILRRRKK